MIVPELICSDIARSLAFYRDVLGFATLYERPAERFAYLVRQGAQLMLEQPLEKGRLFPREALEYPYGRGINLEIEADDVAQIHAALEAAGVERFLEIEERWYGRETDEIGVLQLAVQDPDGYVLRFSQQIGTREF
jgi:catechol 2,3-dioxygenase-like lactoylglutathione lyase family enzyme